jgi:hypothetical protein
VTAVSRATYDDKNQKQEKQTEEQTEKQTEKQTWR